MTKRVRTGVSPFGAVLAFAIVAFVPTAATANSIAPIFDARITADGTEQTFQGEFTLDNDVALMRFFLDAEEYDLTANTTSWGEERGGFDPVLSLYFASDESTLLSEYGIYNYVASDGGLVPAIFDDADTDAGLWNSSLSLTLNAPGAYLLVLTQAGNLRTDSPFFPPFSFQWDAPEFECGDDFDCQPPEGHDLSFSVNAQLTPAGTTPVPEPGTLSLLALGSLATAIVRRRRRRTVTTRP